MKTRTAALSVIAVGSMWFGSSCDSNKSPTPGAAPSAEPEAKAAKAKTTETKTEAKAGGAKTSEAKAPEAKPPEAKAGEPKAEAPKAEAPNTTAKAPDASDSVFVIGVAHMKSNSKSVKHAYSVAADGTITNEEGSELAIATADGKFMIDGKPYLTVLPSGKVEHEGDYAITVDAEGGTMEDMVVRVAADGTLSATTNGKPVTDYEEKPVDTYATTGCVGSMKKVCALVYMEWVLWEAVLEGD